MAHTTALPLHRATIKLAIALTVSLFGSLMGFGLGFGLAPASADSASVTPGITSSVAKWAKLNSLAPKTDNFLKNSFTNGQFVAGFTPGKPDFGFTLEAILQRIALGETKSSLAKAVNYNLTDSSITGTSSTKAGYLFDASGKLQLGLAGKWAFVSAAAKADNSKARKGILGAIESKVDNKGDLAFDTNANTYDRAWVVLGLGANGDRELALAVALNIAKHQSADGGFDDGYTLGTGSPDGSGIVLQALALAKHFANRSQTIKIDAVIAKAGSYLKSTLVGGNHFEADGSYNINGTEYAAMGLTAVNKPVAAIKKFIAGEVSTDGGIVTPWSDGAGDLYATAQGAVAMLGKSYLDLIQLPSGN